MRQSSSGFPRRASMLWTVGLMSLSWAGCGVEGQESPPPRDVNAPVRAETFEEFRAKAWLEQDTGIYVVDGDIPVLGGEAGLREEYERRLRGPASEEGLGTNRAPLIVNTVAGRDDRWTYTQQRYLPYCVSTTFGGNHARVVTAMAQAAAAWQAVNVRFLHRSDQDGNCTAANNNVLFDVNPVSGQGYLARAFFPNYGRAQRNVLIDSSSFGNTGVWTLAGILRHELGHTLGFRHEHTRPEAATCFEDNNWRALTGYDAASVMHYPQCRGSNRGDLDITATDLAGATALYGALSDTHFDVAFYLNNNPDLLAAFGPTNFTAARNHWEASGITEARRSSTHFDAPYYLSLYPDLRAAFGATNYRAARDHWVGGGINEGRRGSREFDVGYYLAFHADLRAAFGNNYAAALNHWRTAGLYEGRRGSAEFDVGYYLAANPDVAAAYGPRNYAAAMDHWIFVGRAQGRRGVP
ncbi:peptidase M10 [Myxococcus landrumensis]|uniref:Peptidase M10 n=2 Tax=Myxococcus landrumensis TaxID=2813577 RepID=A0ABX7N467_9BACT|nr:peptidase M10 [Myxococcus landrumus]